MTASKASAPHPDRFIVGISGASGIVYGVRVLQVLKDTPIETHLVMSKSAEITLAYEMQMKVADVHALADVVMKERRRLVLMVRETPLHLGHLKTMTAVTEMGAIVMPPVPAFYQRPETLDDIVNQSVGRALDLFDLDLGIVKRWGEEGEEGVEGVRNFRRAK